MSIDGVWIKPTTEQAKWFNEGVDTAREIIIKLESKLAAVTADRDRLRRAAEIGREYARYSSNDYMCNQKAVLEDIAAIDAAMRGEPTTTKEPTP
jgi:hypothetical protein